ncbi:M4 family metallopeptidase, partial [Klebsiella pneumoniae]|nr:M4 family metallopeptidase [Klebsiella pneumoniae]
GEVFGPKLADVAGVRSFTADPAYSGHPVLGDDIQPKHMDAYDNRHEDNGGVHINSGIPNHAFYRAAQAIGGNVWEVLVP